LGKASFSGGRALAEQQATLPDIVSDFRSFADTVATNTRVMIGIDELDKIQDVNDAQHFLNDIKGIFGIRNCFFLLSVSEDALSHFDRRGVPVRDAFDSALDTVVYVGYLPLDGTRQLLHRRIIGLGEPFVALCHCLGGGLPRDVIRVARNMVRHTETMTSLPKIVQSLVVDDFETKRRATIVAANAFAPLAEVATALTLIQAAPTPDLPRARSYAAELESSETPSDMAVGQASLRQLLAEFAVYTRLAATTIDVFTTMTTSGVATAFGTGVVGRFDDLAAARQAIAVHPQLADDKLAACRTAWAASALPIPAAGNP
jgi:hypothetical protein